MARPGLLALAIVIMAELTCSVSATARHLTSSNPSPSFPLLAKNDASQPNPLLLDWDIPPYDLIKPDHLVPGVEKIVSQLKSDLAALEAAAKPDYISLVRPLEKIYDRIQVFSYMMANYLRFDSANFGDAAGTASDLLDDLETQMWTSVPILNAFKAIQASPSYSTLTESQQSVVKR
ncbi:putative oligopeptidase A [Dioscorea sansibarensis]